MRVSRLVVLALLLVLLGGGCGSGEATSSSGETQVIIDGDGAFDDIKAILYLLDQPDLEIVAITMSGTGVGHCPRAAENVAALLERIEAPEIPVACGRETPLAGSNAAPSAWRNIADGLGGVDLPEPRPLSDLDAPQLLLETVETASEDIVLVALGPLTNVAEALEQDPDFLEPVEMIYLMGGAVDVAGNVLWANDTAEFNIWADPTAAAIVFAADVPITLVPLDATNEVPVTPYMYDAVAAHRNASPTAQFLAEYLDASPLFGGLYHWDELAAVVTTDESVVTIEERDLSVMVEGMDQGATVDTPDGRPVRVAVAADSAAFERHFYQAMIGTADPGIPAWEPDVMLTWDGTTCSYDGPDALPGDFYALLENVSDEHFALVMGVYADGTTVADLEAAQAAGDPAPSWWTPSGQVVGPAGAREVWQASGGSGITGLCFVDAQRMWEVAGPQLPE